MTIALATVGFAVKFSIRITENKAVRVDWLENLASYKEDYNVSSLFHVVCTVTDRIFCSRCDASLMY